MSDFFTRYRAAAGTTGNEKATMPSTQATQGGQPSDFFSRYKAAASNGSAATKGPQKNKTGDFYTNYKTAVVADYQRRIEQQNKEKKRLDELNGMTSAQIAPYIENKEQPIAYTTLAGEDILWSDLYQKRKFDEDFSTRYNEYSSRPDWYEKSSGRNTLESTQSDYSIITDLNQSLIPYDRQTALDSGISEADFDAVDAKRKYISEKYDVDLSNIYDNTSLLNQLQNKLGEDENEKKTFEFIDSMTEKEKQVLGYIYNTQGRSAAMDWYSSIRDVLQERDTQNTVEGATEMANEAPVLSAVMSVPLTFASATEGVVDLAKYATTGDEQVNKSALLQNAWRSGVSNQVDWNIGNWDAFDFLYNTGMSTIDSAITTYTFGTAGAAIQAVSAGSQAMNDALSRGLDGEWAIFNGVAAGTFEYLFEKFSLGKHNEFKAVIPENFGDVAKNISKEMGVNALEELNTEAANKIYDGVVNGVLHDAIVGGDLSQYANTIRKYKTAGYSEDEAKKKAAIELGAQLVEAAASGALMGFGFSAPTNISSAHRMYSQYTSVGDSILQEKNGVTVESALKYGMSNVPGTSAYQTAKRLSENYQKGKTPTAFELGQLVVQSNAPAARQAKAAYNHTMNSARAHGVTDERATTAATAAARTGRTIEFVSPEQLRIGETDGLNAIVTLDNGKIYVQADRNVLSGNNKEAWKTQIDTFFDNVLEENGSLTVESIEGDTLTITKDNTIWKGKDEHVQIGKKKRNLTKGEYLVKLHAVSHVDELAEVSVAQKNPDGTKLTVADEKNHPFAKDGFNYRTVFFQDYDGKYYRLVLSVGLNDGVATVYNVGQIKETATPEGEIISVIGSKARGATVSDTTVSQNSFGVNTHSMQEGGKYTPSEAALGKYTADGRILLSTDISDEAALNFVLKHELAHSIEGTAAWDAILNAAKRQMGREAWEKKVADTARERQEKGDTVGAANPEREAVADWIGENLYKENFAQALAKNDRQAANIFVQVMDKLRLAFAGTGNRGAAARITALERMYLRALETEQTTGEGQYAAMAIDISSEEPYNSNWESYELTDEFLANVPPTERHAFLRSLANKTAGMKHGEQRNIVIFTEKYVYFYAATGYMNGSIEKVRRYSRATNAQIKEWRDSSVNASATTFDSMAQSYGSRRRRNGWDNAADGYPEETGRPDDVDESAQGSDPIGYIGESDGDFGLDEDFGPGAYVYAGDGQAFKVNDDGTIEDLPFTDAGIIHSQPNTDATESSSTVSETTGTEASFTHAQNGSYSFLPPDLAEANERARQSREQAAVDADTLHRAAVERAVSGQTAITPSQAQTMEELKQELGEEEFHRRLYMANQIDRPEGTIEVDGQRVDVKDYIRAVEDLLPDDIASLEQFIRDAEARSVAAMRAAYEDGTLEQSTRLPINLQLFAAQSKLDWANIAQGEDGKEARQFYEKRLQGMDENHHQELVDMLAGRSETYNPITNEKTLNQAKDNLRRSDWKGDLEKRLFNYRSGQPMLSAVEGAAVQVMINDALNDGEWERADGMIRMYARCGTDLGRAVQIMSLQRKLTPEGTIRAVTKEFQKAADQRLGKHTNESLDNLAGDVTDAITRLKGSRVQGGPTETAATAENATTAPQGGEGVANPLTNEELEDALVRNIRQNGDPYITEEEVRGILHRAIENASDMPAHLKKMLQKDETIADLAQRIAQVEANGHLNDATTRRAFEEALGLPTLSGEDVAQLTELVNRMNSLEEYTLEHQEAMEDIYRFVGSRLPVTKLEGWQAWRKLAMLGNPKTHIRNLTSNVAMYGGVYQVDNALAALMERVFIKDPNQRTTLLGWSRTEHGQRIKDVVDKTAERALVQMRRGGGKYDIAQSKLSGYKKYFGKNRVGEAFNKASDINSNLLEKGDALTFVPAFKKALGQIMTVRGMTEVTDEVYQMAYDQAADVTFRAENALASRINAAKRKGGIVGTMVDIAIPFSKTPANIAVQMVQHSPVGLAKGAFDLVQSVRGAKNAKTAAEAINELAKGITGSALLAIGLLLGNLGLFNTKYGKTEKERAADELAGVQENALVFDGWSITLDWLQPAAAPLVIGASIAQRLQEDGLGVEEVFGAVMDGTDSLFELTMLQSLYDILGGYDAGVSSSLASVVENAASQSVPTLLGQAARSIDPVQRRPSGEGPIGGEFGQYVNQVLAKVPGLTYLLEPELDVWGEEVYRTGKADSTGGWLNFLQQLVLPANVKRATADDDITLMLLDLYENAEEKGSYAIPSAPSRDDATEMDMLYADLARQVGSAQRLAVEDLVGEGKRYTVQETTASGRTRNVSKTWSQMTEPERLRVLNRIYGDVKENVQEPEDDYYMQLLKGVQ